MRMKGHDMLSTPIQRTLYLFLILFNLFSFFPPPSLQRSSFAFPLLFLFLNGLSTLRILLSPDFIDI